MKIISQSFEILPELADPIKQIASRARICYKSEDKAKDDEKPFLKRIKKHEPVFEMAVVTLQLDYNSTVENALRSSNYIQLTLLPDNQMLATGSVRTWREFVKTHHSWYVKYIINALNEYNSFLFPRYKDKHADEISISVVGVEFIPLPKDQYKLHKHVAVKFITNRAVSHELVRHRPVSFLQESQRYCRYKDDVVFIDPTAFDFNEDEYNIWERACNWTEQEYLTLLKTKSPQAARTVLPNSCKTEIIVYCNLREWEHIFNRRTSPAAEPSMHEIMNPLLTEFQLRFPGMFDDLKLSVG